MSFDTGTGIYTLPAGNPVVTQTVIQSSWANTTLSDVAAALNDCYYAGGVKASTGPFMAPANTNCNFTWTGETTSGLALLSAGGANSVAFALRGVGGVILQLATDTAVTPRNTVEMTIHTAGLGGRHIGWMGFPQQDKSADYTLAYGDWGGNIHHPAADANVRTITIPANGAVAWPLGTEQSFTNGNCGVNMLIAIAVDTMRLAGTASTGTRTLAPNSRATAIKVAATEWIISGDGLT